MADKGTEFKETEWDSSKATLQRIDALIRKMQSIKTNEYLGHGEDPKIVYLEALDCLFMEGNNKFTTTEQEECKKHQDQISDIIQKTNGHLFSKHIKNRDSVKINSLYIQAWNEVNVLSRDYELYIMSCLDNHNMLMRNRRDDAGL